MSNRYNCNTRMAMHPDGLAILGVMNDHREHTMSAISEMLGRARKDIRNGVDWLADNHYLNRRKEISDNLNRYSNRAHQSECQKTLHRAWVSWHPPLEESDG